MGSERPDRRSSPLSFPSADGAHAVTVGIGAKFLNTMKDENVEGLNHFRDPKCEAPFVVYLF